MIRTWLLVLLAVLSPAARAAAAEEAARVEYLYRLELPTETDRISFPHCVVADPHSGEIFVCDLRRNRILIFDQEGLFRYRIEGGDTFRAPRDLALDPTGRIVVTAQRQGRSVVLELDFDGLFLREIPISETASPELPRQFTSLALTLDGERLVLLDEANHELLISDRQGAVLESVDLTEGLPATRARDLALGHVDVYGDRILLAVSSEAEIWTFTLEGSLRRRLGLRGTAACQVAFPTAAALDDSGNVVILDQQRMILLLWNPIGNRCLSEHYGFGGNPGYFYLPFDLTLDAAGRAYVSQTFEGRVQVYEGFAPAAGSRDTGTVSSPD